MFSLPNKNKQNLQKEPVVTADELVFPDSSTLGYFTELMGGVVHKHNNFLTVTQGFSQLLLADDHGGSIAKSAETIQKSAQKAIDLNARIIACTTTNEPKLSEFDFSDYFEKKCKKEQGIALSQGIDFEHQISDTVGSICADSAWLSIIFDEILQNAYDAVEERGAGKVLVSSTVSSPLKSDSQLLHFLEIRDSGAGLSHENLSKVFRPFFTTKGRDHIGIGLTRAGVLGGLTGVQIGVASSQDGTVVYLAIPGV